MSCLVFNPSPPKNIFLRFSKRNCVKLNFFDISFEILQQEAHRLGGHMSTIALRWTVRECHEFLEFNIKIR